MTLLIDVDMESGALGAEYDQTRVPGGSTFDITTGQKIHGLYGNRCTQPPAYAGLWNYGLAEFGGDYGEVWIRFYFLLESGFAFDPGDDFTVFAVYRGSSDAGHRINYVNVKESGGSVYLRVRVKDDAGSYYDIPSSPGAEIEVGRVCCVEIHNDRGSASAGTCRAWFDGVEQPDPKTDLDTDWLSTCAMCGPYVSGMAVGTGGTIRFDSIRASDSGRLYPIRGRAAAQVNRTLGHGTGRQIA
jgi:hypothetical protein